jgi:ribonuclease D
MHHPGMKQYVDPIARCIERGLEAPEIRMSKPNRGRRDDVSGLIAQLLQVALASLCRNKKIAPQLVATNEDLREWADYRLSEKRAAQGKNKNAASPSLDNLPRLLTGWRGEIFGTELDGLLHGNVGVFVRSLHSENPLELRHTS